MLSKCLEKEERKLMSRTFLSLAIMNKLNVYVEKYKSILPYYTWNLCDLFMNCLALIFVSCPGIILNVPLISIGSWKLGK